MSKSQQFRYLISLLYTYIAYKRLQSIKFFGFETFNINAQSGQQLLPQTRDSLNHA